MREYPLRYAGTDKNLKKESHYSIFCALSQIINILKNKLYIL